MEKTTTDSEAPSRNDRQKPEHVVYFDGVCGFCNSTVNFLMKRDLQRRLRFAPLQGSTALSSLPEELRQRLDTLVFVSGDRTYVRSSAVVQILLVLGGRWKWLGRLLWLIPRPLRDTGYRLFSKWRYRLFGRRDACRMPAPEERGLILE